MMQVVFTRRGKTPPNAPCQENQRLPCSSAAIFTLFHIVMKVVYEKKPNKKKGRKAHQNTQQKQPQCHRQSLPCAAEESWEVEAPSPSSDAPHGVGVPVAQIGRAHV